MQSDDEGLNIILEFRDPTEEEKILEAEAKRIDDEIYRPRREAAEQERFNQALLKIVESGEFRDLIEKVRKGGE